MKKSFWIYLFITIMMMVGIFYFSAQKGDESGNISMNVTEKIFNEENYHETVDKPVDKKKEEVEFAIRKIAHFLIYSALGFSAFMTLLNSNKVNKTRVLFIASLAFCIIYASSDEFHQLFVTERSGEIRDVLIDSAGSLIGISVAVFMRKIRSGRKAFR